MALSRWENHVLALGAVAQSASLVNELANHGHADIDAISVCTSSLLVLDPKTPQDVFPGAAQLAVGLKVLEDILAGGRSAENGNIIRYLLGMLALRGKLAAHGAMMTHIRTVLSQIEPFTRDSSPEAEEQFFKEVADLYVQTISSFSLRIHVKGNAAWLQDKKVAHRIRALLLAGIRAAMLWHQLGGRRWQLLVYRKRILETATHLRHSQLNRPQA